MMLRSLHVARTWLAAALIVRFVNRRPRFLPWLLVFILVVLVASYLPYLFK
jgi:hypothetical protein